MYIYAYMYNNMYTMYLYTILYISTIHCIVIVRFVLQVQQTRYFRTYIMTRTMFILA